MMATVAMAQVSTNAPAPNVVTKRTTPHHLKDHPKASTKAAAKNPVAHSAKISAPVVALTPGLATIDGDNVNYRGQAGLKGESIGQFHKGEVVTVISEITLDKHAADEPAHWAKIVLPAGTKVWVNKQFVDATDKKVAVKKLNLRAGPGENFSVLGTIEKGAAITEISAKGDWIEVPAPADAYAFVAAHYLQQGNAPATSPVPPTEPPFNPGPGPVVAGAVGPATQIPATAETPVAVPTTVGEPQKIAAPPAPEPTAPPVVPSPVKLAVVAPPVAVDTNLPPPPPRIVTHEGWVRNSVSIVAPTYLELYDPATGKAIDYLYSTTPLLSVARYKGMHVAVEGEEALDSRWKDTPVLTIKKIFVLSTNTPAAK